MVVRFAASTWPDDQAAVIDFLVASEGPFHAQPRLSLEQAARLPLSGDDVASFWIIHNGAAIGLIRLLDLTDLDDGSPVFDLRIAQADRGRGVGRLAVDRLTRHQFASHRRVHRIEATTRADNLGKPTVFDRCGYRQEGRFLEAWLNADGSRSDVAAYAMLRREWAARELTTGLD